MKVKKLNEQQFNTIMAGGTLPPLEDDQDAKQPEQTVQAAQPVETAEKAETAEHAEQAETAEQPTGHSRSGPRTGAGCPGPANGYHPERSECRGGKLQPGRTDPCELLHPGSPVQFVCVELLRGDVSGENAVCLTFKNISRVTLTALEIHFKCKGVDGVILCEDQFEYRDLGSKARRAVWHGRCRVHYAKAITSVDVSLCNVYNGKRVVHLKASSVCACRHPAA